MIRWERGTRKHDWCKMNNDVTKQVQIDWIDGECVGISRCVCGNESEEVLGIYPDLAYECEECERKLYVSIVVNVFEC